MFSLILLFGFLREDSFLPSNLAFILSTALSILGKSTGIESISDKNDDLVETKVLSTP